MSRVIRSRAQWAELIAEQQQSGLTIAEFTRQRKLSETCFYRWKGEFRRESATAVVNAPVSFVEVVPEAPSSTGAAAWLELGGGMTLQFGCLPDPGYICALSRSASR